MKKDRMKFRYRFIYKTVGSLAPLILRKYGFKTDRISKKDEPYIVISNHLTEVDMIMVAGAFAEHMYYVAGEHLLRTKAGPKMKWGQDPIFTYKGSSSIDTMREVLRRIKAGHNVMIFPEGSRSFNGETMKIDSSMAKLVRTAGCALATYHIEGGYFVAPRWAYTTRTGPMKGNIVNIYSSEEIKNMSIAELTDCINRDLYENAYETQRKNMYEYKGERLAEGLENYLVKCSCCGAFDTMVTEDDRFRCSNCGQSGRYTTRGFLDGEGLRFDSVYDWGVWSEEETCRYIEAFEGDQPVFCDTDVVLYEVLSDHSRTDLCSGDIQGYKDRFVIGKDEYLFEDIRGMDMLYFGKTLVFTYKKRHLAITGEQFHAIKYQKLYDTCRNKK
ncbi:MAG: 1-acyl-sn-glycerol-3-phosphate acyltransferase [Mogibacterium sp.]|nr:1-acyl-sn-glycerol-3-phosphate acyltransferase [Mogibacterium sp.]MBR3329663.1 1-acyl-sn-glycerol-3-phosphate acyltransferase [Mogibacterium sp.]MBR4089938.1 1-acyl-sn-glycerol-3-phosphate acyltransferase [Mogibacterium sp.]